MTRYFVDKDGKYLGGFDGVEVEVPKNGVELDGPPKHGLQIYDLKTKKWGEIPANNETQGT